MQNEMPQTYSFPFVGSGLIQVEAYVIKSRKTSIQMARPDPREVSVRISKTRSLFLSSVKILVCFRDNNRAEADKADEIRESHKAIHNI